MSPLTVSTYLDPSMEFDVVIFDEASQLLPEDALASIVRAKQVIIAGDQQQLSPSDWFLKQSEEDIEDEIADDIKGFESILDMACATTIPNILLNWHYRSENEDLIHYSNYHFYDNRLHIFPASGRDNESGVVFNYVNNGIYDFNIK